MYLFHRFRLWCQPPCEAVNWNILRVNLSIYFTSSASLWGCELKCFQSHICCLEVCQPPCEAVNWNKWEQRYERFSKSQPPCEAVNWNCMAGLQSSVFPESASLWGCELKYLLLQYFARSSLSASLWGCELKWICFFNALMAPSQPPCEAVNWNNVDSISALVLMPSASLWGCELKCILNVW